MMKRVLSLFLMLVLLFTLLPQVTLLASAEILFQGECSAVGSAVFWEINSEGELHIFGSGDMADYPITADPVGFGQAPWARIPFSTVYIDEGVTRIGQGAFDKCHGSLIDTVFLPNSLTSIGYRAFGSCKVLRTVEFGRHLEQIDNLAFYKCVSLNDLKLSYVQTEEGVNHLPDELTSIGQYAFSNCSALTNIVLPDSLTEMGNYPFENCTGLKTVTFGSGLTSISYGAFAGCASLTSVTIPDTVVSIQPRAFRDCSSLTEVFIGSGIQGIATGYGIYTNDNGAFYRSGPLTLHINTPIVSAWFADDDNLVEVVLGPKVEELNDGTFQDCDALEYVRFDENSSLHTIGGQAFYSCDSLKEIIVPDSVTRIEGGAFYDCGALSYVSIPSSVTETVGTLLGSSGPFTLNVDIPTVGSAFAYSGVQTLRLGPHVTSLGQNAFRGCPYLENIEFNEALTEIGTAAFSQCTALQELTLPDNVASLGESAFCGCTGLKEIRLSAGMEGVERWTFQDCSSLQQVTLPEGIQRVEECAFSRCSALKSIDLPDTLTHTGGFVFEECTALESIDLPDSLTDLGIADFQNCTGLKHIGLPGGINAVSNQLCQGCTSLEEVVIPDGVTAINGWAFYDCSSLKNVVIPDSVTSINAIAFRNCTSLEEITIPEGVQLLGNGAFRGCTSLKHIELPSSVSRVYADCLSGCAALERVTVYNANCEIRSGENTLGVKGTTLIVGHAGSTAESYAQQYGFSFESLETICADGHNYQAVVTAPTCTKDGYTTYTCTRCGDSYKDDVVAATGHAWGPWEVTTPATGATPGEETRTCTLCGATETRSYEDSGREYYGWYESDDGCVFITTDSTMPEAVEEDFMVPRNRIPMAADVSELKLLFDRSLGADVEPYYNGGDLFFYDREPEGLDELYVLIELYDGSAWTDIWVVEHGVVAEGYTLENNLLSVPIGDSLFADVYVFWTEACYQFNFFSGTEAYPNVVNLNYWGRGTLELPDTVLPENTMYYKNNIIARVAEDVEELTVSWPEGCRLYYIGGYFGTGWEWIEPELPDDNSYTLNIKRYYEDGERMTYNYAEFGFDDWYRDFNGAFRVDLTYGLGTACWSVGDAMPELSEESFVWSYDDRYSFVDGDGNPQTIHVLIDPDQLLADSYWETGEFALEDSWVDEADRAIYIVAECARADGGWMEAPVVENGAAIMDGFTFENDVLSYTPISAEEVSFRVFFTEADYRFWYYPSTEECPVLIQYSTNDPESLMPPEEVSEENRIACYDGWWSKLRVSADAESLTFTWPEDAVMQEIRLEDYYSEGNWQPVEFEGNSFTLLFDAPDEDGNLRDWYNLYFEFVNYDWVGQDRQLCAWYDRWPGSVFWSVGSETPTADMDHYLNEGWDYSVCFTPNGEFEPLHLLLDNTQGINWDIWDAEGRVELEERDPEWDSDGYYADARYVDDNGEWYDGPVLYNGEVVRDGWTFENNVLSYTPANDFDIEVNVWWRESDYLLDHFYATEERPVIINVSCYGEFDENAIPVPEGIDEDDYISVGNRMRIRVPWDTESITFTWNGNLLSVSYDDMLEEYAWLDAVPAGDSYTLYLDNNWEDGSPWDWYNIDFNFDWGEKTFYVDYSGGSHGTVYQSVGDVPPEKSAETLAQGEASYAGENGESLPIRLRFDPDHSGWIDEDGRLAEDASCYLPNRELYVWMSYSLEDNTWIEEFVVEHGKAVADYAEFADNNLTIDTEGKYGIGITVAWTQAEADVYSFQPTEDKPVLVWWKLYAHNEDQINAVYLPEGVDAEDMVFADGFGAARVSLDTETLTFRWKTDVGLNGILNRISPEDPEWEEIPTENGFFTLTLDQTNDDGSPNDFYHVLFFFEEQQPVQENPFEDVPEGAYYADAVAWAVANGVTNGTGPTSFSPSSTCTRGQVVTFLWRAKGSPEPEKTDNPFEDVEEGKYYFKAVLWAVENGITNGTGPTTFGPNNGCTRGQVVTFLWRTDGSPEPTSEENPFEDVTGGYYYKAVLWAVENKITAGIDATHFKPDNTCTRGQIVTFLYRDLKDG